MNRILNFVSIAILLLFCGLIVGCYTMLTHPAIVDEANESQAEEDTYQETEINYSSNCLQCHDSHKESYIGTYYEHYDDNYMDEAYVEPFHYWELGARSTYYYSTPWWIDDFLYTPPAVARNPNKPDGTPQPGDFSGKRTPNTDYGSPPAVRSGTSVGSVPAASGSSSSSSPGATPQRSKKRTVTQTNDDSQKETNSGTAKSRSSSKSKSATRKE